MRPKLEEEDSEITKMSIFMLNYYQDAEARFDKLEELLTKLIGTNINNTVDLIGIKNEARIYLDKD